MKKTRKEKGITLIALVVTIIILLILAGVSIQLVTNNGIFEYTNKAKIEFKRAQISEKLSLILTLEQINNSGGSEDELVEATRVSASEDEELKSMGKKVTVDPKTSTEEDGKIVDVYFYVEVDEDVYKVDKTGARFIGEKGKFPPVVIIENMQITSNSIKITVKTSRNDEGQIEIYKKSKEDADYVSVKKDINENIVGIEQTISGLTQNETYIIKIVATATNGQTAEVTQEATIGSVPNLTTADITFTYTVEEEKITETTWTNKDVKVTANTSIQGYELQTSNDGHTWSDEPSQTFEKNGTMYVALYDGTNYGGTATANIKNIDKLEPKDLTPSISVSNNKVIVDATGAKDAEATDDYGNSGISKVYFIEGTEETEESTKKYTCKNISGTNDTIKLKKE